MGPRPRELKRSLDAATSSSKSNTATRPGDFLIQDAILPRFSSIAAKNQFPTTDFKMRYSPRFSSTAEKFLASTNISYYEKEDKINEKVDRISELPQNVIDLIFDRMLIRDAARTTLLSRKWRRVWASHPKLDEKFFQEILIRHEQSIQYEFTKAMSKALSFHGGFLIYSRRLINGCYSCQETGSKNLRLTIQA